MALTADQLNTIYQNVLFRNVDAGGISYFANRTDISDAQVRQQIELSAEASTYVTPVVRLYQEVLGRVPDQAGLRFFSTELRNGFTLEQVTQQFLTSAEFTAKSTATAGAVDATDTGNQLVTDAFQSILGRAPAASEFAFFAGKSAAQVLSLVANSPEAANAQAANVTTFLDAVAQGTYPTGSLSNQTGSGGTGGTNAGLNVTLSPNVDAPGAASPSVNTQGGANNDTFNAVLDAPGGASTLNTADSINGGAGTDTLNVRIVGNLGTATPVIQNVENIVLSNVTTGNTGTLDLGSSSGYTTVSVKDSVAGTTTSFTNVAAGTTLSLDNADGVSTFQVNGAANRTGTSDAVSINVANGTGTKAAPATLSLLAAGGGADTTFEVANITTSGANSFVNVANGSANFNTIKVTGSAGLTLTSATDFANVKSIDASGLTGTSGLNVTVDASQDLTFTGSGGDDRLAVTFSTNLNANDKLAFGAGTDTLAFTGVTDETAFTAAIKGSINAATGLEVIEFSAANVTAVNASDFTSVNTFDFSGGTTAATNLAITGVESADLFKFSADHTGTVTFTGAAVAQNAHIALSGGTDLVGSAGASALAFGANITTLTIDSNGTTANTITGAAGTVGANALPASGLPGGAGGAGGDAIANGTAVQSVTITGAQNLTIGGGAGGAGGAGDGAGGVGATGAAGNGFSGAVSVDASAMTGKLNISGSTGNDIIKFGTGTAGDATLTHNTFVAGGGNDSVTLNTGADWLDYRTGTAASSATAIDTVTNFTAGSDKFVVGTAVTGVSTTSFNGTGNLGNDITNSLTLSGGNGFGAGNNAAVVTINGGADAGTYLVADTNGGGFNAANDLVVKLVGLTGTVTTADFTTTLTA
ncbi:DUF4214 domain-containing protein [Methylobacterium nigriterrae]|uniref:DUF4214 domain-containing protein n=1 Tax=Methylobacterium nigriterrae TaxID=3127512 RepID=UPI003013C0E2